MTARSLTAVKSTISTKSSSYSINSNAKNAFLLSAVQIPSVGTYHISVTVNGERVLGSPFVMQVEEDVDA